MGKYNREEAVDLLHKYVTTEHIIKHSYAVESVMRALAKKLEPENEQLWGVAGLLHDLDNDLVDWQSDMSLHGPKTVEVLKTHGYGDEILYRAILAHNPANHSSRDSKLEKAIYAGDPITGFINAIAMVYPDKKISSVKVSSIVKRMKEKRFAAGANREAMQSIEELEIPFHAFAEIALDAMCEISEVLGL